MQNKQQSIKMGCVYLHSTKIMHQNYDGNASVGTNGMPRFQRFKMAVGAKYASRKLTIEDLLKDLVYSL